jgi:hypothetical protein
MKLARRLPVCLLLFAAAWCLASAQSDRAAQQRQERLAKHAELFKSSSIGPPLEQRKPNAKGEIDLSQHWILDYAVSEEVITPDRMFAAWAAHSDVIVEGTAEQWYSALTQRRNFVYSDWEFRVSRVFKNTSSLPVVQGDLITVVQAGGQLTVDGRTVFAHLTGVTEYKLNQSYLLYLQALPESQSFRSYGQGFELDPRGPKCMFDDDGLGPQLKALCKSLSYATLVSAVEKSVAK